jgi:hypothetical protein
MNINTQLAIIGKKLYKRMEELDLTPRIIQQRSSLALNSVKTAMTGKKCNVGTLAKICDAMGWTLFDLFREEKETVPEKEEAQPEDVQEPVPSPASEATPII